MDKLRLLPEGMLREVLRFVEALVERFAGGKVVAEAHQAEAGKHSLGEAVRLLRSQIKSEESPLEDEDTFSDIRNRTPAPLEPDW